MREKHDLPKIMQKIVRDSYPFLAGDRIDIFFDDRFKEGLMEFDRVRSDHFTIKVNRAMEKCPKDALIGCIAHELAHIVTEKRMGFLSSWFDGQLYRLSKRYRRLDERNADLGAMIRGYGHELLALHRYRRVLRLEELEDNGLTRQEIQALLKR